MKKWMTYLAVVMMALTMSIGMAACGGDEPDTAGALEDAGEALGDAAEDAAEAAEDAKEAVEGE